MVTKRHLVGIILAATTSLAAPVQADELRQAWTTVGQPAAFGLPVEAAAIDGYRSARFGMSEAEVRMAVDADFGAEAGGTLSPESVEEGFTALGSAPVETEIGRSRLLYVFDPSRRLVAVNLVRTTGDRPSPDERNALISASANVASGLLAKRWRPFAMARGRPLPNNQVIVFAAADDVGNGVELRLIGVEYEATGPDGRRFGSGPATGAAALRLVFRQDIDGLALLRPGDF
jgi:hypothetical protein